MSTLSTRDDIRKESRRRNYISAYYRAEQEAVELLQNSNLTAQDIVRFALRVSRRFVKIKVQKQGNKAKTQK